jgi:hypothetical protein
MRPKRATAQPAAAYSEEDKQLDAVLGGGASPALPDEEAAKLVIGEGEAAGLDGSGWVVAGFNLRCLTLSDLMIFMRSNNALVTAKADNVADTVLAACEVVFIGSLPTSREALAVSKAPDYRQQVEEFSASIPYGPAVFELVSEVTQYLQDGGRTRVLASAPATPGLPRTEGNDCTPPGQSD